MAKRAPEFIDMITTAIGFAAPVDPVPASPSIPQTVDSVQHALATAGKHQGGMCVGLFVPNNTTATILVPVPPSVVYMRISFMCSGAADISIDSTNNGTAKTFEALEAEVDAVQSAKQYGTTNIPGDLFNSPLKVRSSAAWTWTTEAVTVTFATSSALSGETGFLYGIAFDPIWEPQTV